MKMNFENKKPKKAAAESQDEYGAAVLQEFLNVRNRARRRAPASRKSIETVDTSPELPANIPLETSDETTIPHSAVQEISKTPVKKRSSKTPGEQLVAKTKLKIERQNKKTDELATFSSGITRKKEKSTGIPAPERPKKQRAPLESLYKKNVRRSGEELPITPIIDLSRERLITPDEYEHYEDDLRERREQLQASDTATIETLPPNPDLPQDPFDAIDSAGDHH